MDSTPVSLKEMAPLVQVEEEPVATAEIAEGSETSANTAAQNSVQGSTQGESEGRGEVESPGEEGRGGATITYVTQKGDTLMKIAFKTLGNVYRWKEIHRRNTNVLPNINSIDAGIRLTIATRGAVKSTKNGLPYLIKRRDSLWKISQNLYNTPWKWSSLWKNNRELIRDPNWIFAGFSLYYVPPADDVLRTPASTPNYRLKPAKP